MRLWVPDRPGSLAGVVKLADGTRPQSFDITLTAFEQGFARRDDFFGTDGAPTSPTPG